MRWLISFSVGLSLASAATVTGQVELTNSKNAAVRRHKDYAGVVLWLEPLDRPAPAVSGRRVEMKQKDKEFQPHVVAVPLGGTVDFPNLDLIFHNAFSNFSGQPFDVGLYPPRTSRSVVFKHPGIVRVFCNIHSTMSAIIAVVNSPWYAVSNSTGQYTIAGVPPGEYRLHIFHERALEENLHFLEHPVTVPEGGLVNPLISISETGFIPAPHLNKFGQEYPPVTNDSAYPGAPKK
ncbi:MAG TPA: carboxypeptidase regulatory-like domain-containing protein [Candidatus Solibacter sp.]